MATIRAYTTIEQSRKLAEILPLESADMVLLHEEPYETSDSKFDGLHQALCVPFSKYDKSLRQKYKNISYFPCWSISALLDVFPDGTDIVKDKADTENEKYMCTVGVKDDIISTFGNNPIDACYEMIIKLSELKML